MTRLWAADFGLILDVTPGAGDSGTGNKFDFSGLFIPRFSVPVGEGEVFVSAAFRADYENEEWDVIPEILRTEFSARFNDLEIKIGRTPYADPLGFIANGLFDGVRLSYDTELAGTFGCGVLYTGLLSKKRANITMTGEELISYNTKTDYSDFAGTYFAPRRLIASLGWEHQGLGELVRAKAAFISQSDLSDAGLSGRGLHSQYLAVKFTAPAGSFVFDLGGCLEFIQDEGDKARLGMAGEFGVSCNLPGGPEDRLSFTGRFSSGIAENGKDGASSKDGAVSAFLPVTTAGHGYVLKTKLSGLSALSLDYIARLRETLSAGLSSVYFIRSDLATYVNYGDKGYFLGNEFFGRLIWSPVSDVQVNMGAGVFLPSMGDVSPRSDTLWRVELNIITALY